MILLKPVSFLYPKSLQELQTFLISEEKSNWLHMTCHTQVNGKLLWSHLLLPHPTPTPQLTLFRPHRLPCHSCTCQVCSLLGTLPFTVPISAQISGKPTKFLRARKQCAPSTSLSPISPYTAWFLPITFITTWYITYPCSPECYWSSVVMRSGVL